MSSKQKGRARAHNEDLVRSRAVGEEHAADEEHAVSEEHTVSENQFADEAMVVDEAIVVDADIPGVEEETSVGSDAQPGETGWRERASFAVAFDSAPGMLDDIIWRTRAYHDETDARADWPGVVGATLFDWMREQAHLPTEADPVIVSIGQESSSMAEEPLAEEQAPYGEETSLGAGEPAPVASREPVLGLELSELLLAEVMIEQELGSLGRMLPAPVYARRLRSQIHFTLTGPAAVEAALNRSHYTVQIGVCSLATGEMQVLAGEQAELKPYAARYTSRSEFAMPSLGSYRVLATVLLPDEGVVGVALGPMLTVMP